MKKMETEPEHKEKMDLRSEIREEAQQKASVEFIPGEKKISYHFKLKDFSSKGFGIIVRKDSKVLEHIKTGDVLNMKYHPSEAIANPEAHLTKIQHISEPEPGKHIDHMIVGLLIIEE